MSTRTLTITSLDEIATGVGDNGRPWTLYSVSANDEHGIPVPESLKSFQKLPIGEKIEVEVEKQDHPQYGTSYLLKRPRENSNGLQARIEALEQRVEALEQT